MKNNNDLFSKPKKNKKHNPYIKYIIIAFSLFVVILAAFSAFMFMRGIDFDLKNIVDRKDEVSTDSTETTTLKRSITELSGKTDYLFLITDSADNANFGFVITADFDSDKISVRSFSASSASGDGKKYSEIYKTSYIDGLKKCLNSDYSVSIEKYIACKPAQFKDIISLFGGVTVNVTENIDYKSSEFSLFLDRGKQKLSNEYAYKYLLVSDDENRARIMCDILISVLTPEYSAEADRLFEKFCNCCNTNISIIDYSNASEKLYVYSNADDKFLPSAA